MTTTVVHIKKEPFDVYIGRPKGNPEFHYGNPFTFKEGTKASVMVSSREEAVARYGSWLSGETDHDLEQDRRNWILDHIPELKGKVLGCFCKPAACHGDVLAKLTENKED